MNEQTPVEVPQAKPQIIISMDQGQLAVQTNIGDQIVVLGMLEKAKQDLGFHWQRQQASRQLVRPPLNLDPRKLRQN